MQPNGTHLSGDNLYRADIYDKDYETFVSCLRKGFKANNRRKAKAISGGFRPAVICSGAPQAFSVRWYSVTSREGYLEGVEWTEPRVDV